MPVQNIECQIAQAQITRLLAGDSFSNDVLTALESHIAECPDCRQQVSKRRSALEAMVAEAESTAQRAGDSRIPDVNLLKAQFKPGQMEPADDPPGSKATPQVPAPIRKAAVQTHRESTTVQSFWKPLGYSGALAAVLFAMSYVMKNPTAIFGNKAVEMLATQPAAKTGAATTTTHAAGKPTKSTSTTPPEAAARTAGAPDVAKPSQEPRPSILANDETPTAEPIERIVPTVTTPPRRVPRLRHHHRIGRKPAAVRHRPKPRHPRNSLRFYDADGRPIN